MIPSSIPAPITPAFMSALRRTAARIRSLSSPVTSSAPILVCNLAFAFLRNSSICLSSLLLPKRSATASARSLRRASSVVKLSIALFFASSRIVVSASALSFLTAFPLRFSIFASSCWISGVSLPSEYSPFSSFIMAISNMGVPFWPYSLRMITFSPPNSKLSV